MPAYKLPSMSAAVGPVDRTGRPRRVPTAAELELVAQDLFADRGFTATPVDDIAAAAGIALGTFFFDNASKKDLVSGEFGTGVRAMA